MPQPPKMMSSERALVTPPNSSVAGFQLGSWLNGVRLTAFFSSSVGLEMPCWIDPGVAIASFIMSPLKVLVSPLSTLSLATPYRASP